MNIEKAKCIPMSEILDILNYKPHKSDTKDSWYLSPLRNEKTPSFHVNHTKNVWYDFGSGEGGDSIGFVTAYLKATNEADTIADALRWLKNMVGDRHAFPKPVTFSELTPEESKLELKSVNNVNFFGLNNYLVSRGISLTVAHKYLKEVRVINKATQKEIIALGLKNEEKGYEIRNSFFKGCVGKKEISFIRGNTPKPKGINIFEGMFDFLTVVTKLNGKPIENDNIILNSTSLIERAYPYIKGYGYQVIYSWMDNDKAGELAEQRIEEICKSEENLTHRSMRHLYPSYNDVNAFHMRKLTP